jgi:AcrR family transcriptional regulator
MRTPSTPPQPLGLRERKKRETAQALQLAALELVAEHGLDEVTVEQIAAAANVSPRTFFNYYPSKEVALVALQPGATASFAEALLARPSDEDLLEAARAALAADVPRITANADRHRLRTTVIARHEELRPHLIGAFAEWERAVTTAIAARTGTDPATDLLPGLAAATFAGIIRESLRRWRASDFQLPLDEVFDEAFALIGNGLGGRA